MKPAGRAPYLHILHALAEGAEWSLVLRDLRSFGNLRGSVGQVVEKGFLEDLIDGDEDLRRLLHYGAKILTVEDPQLVFFLKWIPWDTFAKEIGFLEVNFEKRYDFALSFAGSDRQVAEALFEGLTSEEVDVFYDKNEQHRIIAADLEEYLRPIYQSEASFVICLLGPDHPTRIWAKFESDSFKQRFKDGAVIPIWFADAPPGIFDESRQVGGIDFDRQKDVAVQIAAIVDTLVRKLSEHRFAPQPSP